jgi:hypothetical protein
VQEESDVRKLAEHGVFLPAIIHGFPFSRQ